MATGPMEMTPMEPMMELGSATIFVAPQAAIYAPEAPIPRTKGDDGLPGGKAGHSAVEVFRGRGRASGGVDFEDYSPDALVLLEAVYEVDVLTDFRAALYGSEKLDDGDAGLNGEGDAPNGGAGVGGHGARGVGKVLAGEAGEASGGFITDSCADQANGEKVGIFGDSHWSSREMLIIRVKGCSRGESGGGRRRYEP